MSLNIPGNRNASALFLVSRRSGFNPSSCPVHRDRLTHLSGAHLLTARIQARRPSKTRLLQSSKERREDLTDSQISGSLSRVSVAEKSSWIQKEVII